MKNLFIVFEGIDGSGTSTQSSLLKEYFTDKSSNVILTYEPSSGPIGNLIREALKKRVIFAEDSKRFDEQMAYLFAADRCDHLYNPVDGVCKFLNNNFSVISTRYYFSSLAYHCSSPEEFDFVQTLNERFPNPDLVIYVDIPVEVALTRISQRSSIDIYENQEKLTKVRNNYKNIFLNYEGLVLKVDGTQQQEAIHQQIVSFIKENFPE